MPDRAAKIRELMESFHAFKRAVMLRTASARRGPSVTPAQAGVLMTIRRHQGECTVKDAALALGMSSSAATQLVDGLVAAGYVTRGTDADDRRRVTLTLTRKAAARMEKMHARTAAAVAVMFDALTDRELDLYLRLHRKIVDRLSSR